MTSRRSEAELTTVYAIILAFFFSGIFVPAYAQNKTAAPAERKKTAVNFEDQLIQGELNKPEFFYFLQRKQFNFGRLIKFRENFLLEMKKTTEQIERKGSSQ
jgi:hypothetical protein